MKHVYLSIEDMTDGFTITEGKVKISDNYLSVAQSDARYQPVGTYATTDELLDTNDRIDLLSDVYQPLGNYVTTEFADENYITDADMQLYVVRTELEDYATKQYVDDALLGFEGGTGSGGGFNGNFTGNSTFTGDMTVTGELTVPLIYDSVGTRQIQIADIITTAELNDLLPGLGGGEAYELPIATSEVLGGVKIGAGIEVDANGVISVTQNGEGGGSDYILPAATKTTLGGVIAGDNVDIDSDGKISVTFPETSGGGDYTLPTASADTLGGVKIGQNIDITDGVISVTFPEQSGGGSDYILPTATDTVLGGVKIGENINMTDGVISVTFPETSSDYVLPIASDSTLGGIKIGSGLSVDAEGIVSATGGAEEYVLPTASASVLGGVKVGTGLAINGSGVLSSTVQAFDGNFVGQMKIAGNLIVEGSIYHKGEIIQQESGLDYKNDSLKALFEHGQMIVGTPKPTGEIVYEADGTFSDDDGGYSGKLTPEGYLDLSVQNKIKTSIANCDTLNTQCFAYVEIIGKIGTANSIFAPMVRTDLGTGSNSFLGTKNAPTSQAIGNAMTNGLNRLVFVPTTPPNGDIFVNGVKVAGSNMLSRPIGDDADVWMAYCWAAGGTGLLKKCAWVSYSDYGYAGDADGIAISLEGFKDYPAPVLKTLRAENELSTLKRRVDDLTALVEGIVGGASGNAQVKPVAKFKRR